MRNKTIFWGILTHTFNSCCHTQLHILSLLSQIMCSSGDETCDLSGNFATVLQNIQNWKAET